MKVELRVRRQASPTSAATFVTYEVEATASDSVWDCLERIVRTIDPTLALRDNCFAAVCGECGIRVNGKALLGCTARIRDLGPVLTIEPLERHRVERDLIVDHDAHHSRLRAAAATFVPGEPRETIDDRELSTARAITACHHCGLCLSVCQSYDDPARAEFVGPAAMAWTYRFLADPRDGARSQREALVASARGAAACVECGACDAACPEHVAPLSWIRQAREGA